MALIEAPPEIHRAVLPGPGRVLIACDDTALSAELAALLFEDGYDAVHLAPADLEPKGSLPSDTCCVLADVEPLPGAGLQLIASLRARGEIAPVILISKAADVAHCVRALRAGAADFLPWPCDRRSFANAIQHARELNRKRRETAQRKFAMMQRFATLTRRERQVMEAVVRGLMNKQIAWELDISEVTVKLHRAKLMRKLQLRSVPDLVRASMSLAA